MMPSKAEVYLALVALAMLAGWRFAAYERGVGAREERSSAAVRVVKHFTDSLKVLDVRYKHDSVTTIKTITDYQHTTDTVTLVRHDTATVYVEKAVADSAINACTSLLHSCDIRIALRDSVIAGQQRQIANVPKPPGVIAVWSARLAAAAVGYEVCRLRL